MFFYSKDEFVNYILNVIAKVKKENNIKRVTQIQIQKIIYIVYSYFLLFRQKVANIEFETWRWGPVIYDLWKKHTNYARSDIPITYSKELHLKIESQNKKDNKITYSIVLFLLKLKSWDIVEICHEQTPWKKLYKPSKNNLIKDQDIIRFHNENEDNFFHYIDFMVKNVLK
ncbi:type II toxin-antitoxin system antitoxin SocA domain-containing protein [Spiroplasma monobiae]|uniref:Antitoxin SocA-like Panacea domain-containing protein n=1 Tax=Spiroplasma monobiae MQ-1 TaxID=1336748 RepID=A0A2K9LX33_SPISQ|nr:type II toxin-antitoxin system antitoxin SocA domain-containing protein [Spiroplasma monobiae]AUM62925.1 hypothetical protein SMONO_v1c06760 [Spiroplasma monobiae MQ-1]